MSVLTPLVTDITNVPIASELEDISAIAESPWILLFSFNFKIRKDAKATTGKANVSGVKLSTVAIAKALKPTCERPSPIMEFLFCTKERLSVTSEDKKTLYDKSSTKLALIFYFLWLVFIFSYLTVPRCCVIICGIGEWKYGK